MRLPCTRPLFFVLAAATTLMLTTFPVNANTILPGQTVAPDVFTLTSVPPLLGQINGSFSLSVGGGTITGTYVDAVLVDPLGVTCTGCLDFALQISVDSGSPGAIEQVFNGGLKAGGTPWATDVGYVTGSGDIAPSSVNYGPAGVDMRFNLALPLTAGESTDFLVIATDATSYNTIDVTPSQALSTGGILQLSGTNGTGVAGDVGMPGNFFAPAPLATPEPSTLWLTAAGLLGLMGTVLLRNRLA
jgi:hypothetical protein